MKNNKGFIVPLLLGIIVLLLAGGGIYLYQNRTAEVVTIVDTKTQDQPNSTVEKNCDYYYQKNLIFSCLISPDKKWITSEMHNGQFYYGLKLVETATDKSTILSEQRYDLAMLWFSDSKRILGFSGSFPSMDCEGNAVDCPRGASDNRKIVIWNVESKTYTAVAVTTPPLSYDMEWIVPDHTAYIYAADTSGSEGDNFHYTLNLDNKTISGPTKNTKLR